MKQQVNVLLGITAQSHYRPPGVQKLTLIFGVLKFRQLSNNEQEVDDGEVRQALCGDVDLRKDR